MGILDEIGVMHRRDVQECFHEMIRQWLKNPEKATWEALVEALQSSMIQEHRLAERLRKKYIPTPAEGNNKPSSEIKTIIHTLLLFITPGKMMFLCTSTLA